MRDGEEIELGNTRVRVLHTPGHSPESVSLLVTDLKRGTDPWFVLTGDTLFVGAVGRPDLPGRARENAAQLYTSIHEKLLTLPDDLEIYPGHFSGSLCGAGLSGKPSSTVAFETRWNPMLSMDRDAFIAALADVPAKPAEMERILAANRGVRDGDARVSSATRHGSLYGRFVSGFAKTPRSSRCWSSSTPSWAPWWAWSAASCPRSPTQEFHLAARHGDAVVHRRVRSHQGVHELRGRTIRGPSRAQALLVAGWLVAAPVPFLLMWAPTLDLGPRRERAARRQPGTHLVDDRHHEDRSGGPDAARPRDGTERVRRLPRRRRVRAGDRLDRRTVRAPPGALLPRHRVRRRRARAVGLPRARDRRSCRPSSRHSSARCRAEACPLRARCSGARRSAIATSPA